MQIIAIAIVAAIIFGICYAVDKLFAKLFRSKAQHRSGMAVRATKQYGLFGVILTILGILALLIRNDGSPVLLYGGIFVILLGAYLICYYLGFGIFYDGESFLMSSLGRKSREYRYGDIVQQRLYAVTGGNIIVELEMRDGSTVSLHSRLDGIYTFLDTAFAGYCLQKGLKPADCKFYDPSKSWWFPHEEEN